MAAWFCLWMSILGVLFRLQLQTVNAQDVSFTVPSTWRNTSSNLTLEQRNALAGAIVDTLRPQYNESTGLIPSLYFEANFDLFTSISWLDYINGTRNYENLVLPNLKVVSTRRPLNSESVTLGLAAFHAWQAYNDIDSLNIAMTLWDHLYGVFFVQPSDAENGTQSSRSVPFNSTCNGTTTAGGVFYVAGDPTADTVVNTETIGAFTSLSSYLYSVTSNTTYSSAAQLAAEFIWSHLYNGSIILDDIALAGCKNVNYNDFLSYNSGLTIEALAAIATWNNSWVPRLDTLISTAVPYPFWTSVNGINIEDNDSTNAVLQSDFLHPLKVFIIRGLYAAWNTSEPGSSRANYIEAYINVQMNALLNLASTPNSNQYSSNWQGPPVEPLIPWGQVDALEVFRAAVGFAMTSQSSTSSSSTPAGSSKPSTSPADSSDTTRLSKGAVAGIAVGACAMLTTSAVLVLRYLKYKKRHHEERARHLLEFTPVPYDSPRERSHPAGTAQYGSEKSDIQMQPTPGTSRIPTGDPRHLPESTAQLTTVGTPTSPQSTASPVHAPPEAVVPPAPQNRGTDGSDIASVEGLLNVLLNRALARLPPGGAEREEPPEYGA